MKRPDIEAIAQEAGATIVVVNGSEKDALAGLLDLRARVGALCIYCRRLEAVAKAARDAQGFLMHKARRDFNERQIVDGLVIALAALDQEDADAAT